MTAPLSLAIVCFPGLGGSSVVASELADGLAARGHTVHLVAKAPPPRSGAAGSRVQFHPVATPEYPVFEHAPYTLALASTLIELGRAQRLDLIQVHYAVPHAAAGYLARGALGPGGPKLVTSLHGTDVTHLGADRAYRAGTCFTISASDGITVPSAFLRDQARERLGLPAQLPVEVIPNFVDTEKFCPPARREPSTLRALFDDAEEGPVLFHVSNFRAVKRPVDLVEVLARVRRHLPARLVLVGEGPERKATAQRARELGLLAHVRFLGRHDDFVGLLQHADGFLLPSATESFGVAALEALSAGVPVFGFRVGGLPEVVCEGVGRLVPPFDVNALAAGVVEVLGNPELHAALSRKARAHALAQFQLGPALARYEAYFRRVLGR
jgi:N-acetyl-alpha-D-glucosaminyl L-malate synthase BshA